MKHTCHAIDCETPTPPSMHMCKHHWYMVPTQLRHALWEAYIPGQEIEKNPTREYLFAAQNCINAVAEKEHKTKRIKLV